MSVWSCSILLCLQDGFEPVAADLIELAVIHGPAVNGLNRPGLHRIEPAPGIDSLPNDVRLAQGLKWTEKSRHRYIGARLRSAGAEFAFVQKALDALR